MPPQICDISFPFLQRSFRFPVLSQSGFLASDISQDLPSRQIQSKRHVLSGLGRPTLRHLAGVVPWGTRGDGRDPLDEAWEWLALTAEVQHGRSA